MNFWINYQTSDRVASYAAEELERCLILMDPTVSKDKGGICIDLIVEKDEASNDHIIISLKDGIGIIQGNTPCAMLIATYRMLYELGCRWTAVGKDGEHIPQKILQKSDFNFNIDETASYKHRAVCIEGAASEENIRDMIEYLPRVGMNTYHVQFHVPTFFLNCWYQHIGNPLLESEDFSEERAREILKRLDDEMAKRGIQHHAVGHGWTCVPFGIPNLGWEEYTEEVPQEYIDMTAMVNGKRGLWGGMPINTNLCYSQDRAREILTNGAVDFCRENPQVDAIYVVLADNLNSNCECDTCREKTACDWYVQILNEIDDKLTKENLPTKIVFCLYQDALWTPTNVTLNKSDRFILSLAPISRTYSAPLYDGKSEYGLSSHDEWELNKVRLPDNVDVNLSFFREWQEIYDGDTFLFDYHLMWDHCFDPGYMDCARGIHTDIQNLQLLKLNGYTSCQLTRAAFPTNLPLYTMAKTLWNREVSFDDIAKEYFEAEFGSLAEEIRNYLEELTKRFDPPYLRCEKTVIDPEREKMFRSIPGFVEDFRIRHPQMQYDSENLSWRVLALHADVVIMLSMLLARKAAGQERYDLADAIRTYVRTNEMLIQPRLDVRNYTERGYIQQFLYKQESNIDPTTANPWG